MKINLTLHDKYLKDHLNISPFVVDENEVVKRGNPTNLDEFVDDGEAEEILAIDVLSYYPMSDVTQIINHWVGKLAIGGKIIIGDTDILMFANLLDQYKLDTIAANQILYNNINNVLVKRSCFNVNDILTLLKNLGLKIQKQRLTGINFVVEATR